LGLTNFNPMARRYTAGILKRLDKAGILKYFNFKLTNTYGNKRIAIPIINAIGYQLYTVSEKWATDLYEKLLKINPGTFVDVGANNGQTLLKIASFSKNLSYIGFEPNPSCFYYLKKLIDANKFTGCNIFPVGLHYENKITTLISDNDFASGASVLQDFREDITKFNIRQNVPLMKGDEIFEVLDNKMAVLKADVEGSELEVIKGLQQTIVRDAPFIVLEILPVYSLAKKNGVYRKQRQDELLEVLKQLGYLMYRIDESTGDLTPLKDIEVHNDIRKTNYLFAPAAQAEAVSKSFSVTA